MARSSIGSAANIANFAAIHFNPREIDGLIGLHGNHSEYRKGVICPCNRIETGQGAAGCPQCRGLSWVHPKELRGRCMFLDASRSNRGKANPAGWTLSGTLQVTLPSALVPAVGDILLPCGEVHIVHEQFHRGVQQMSQLELRRRARQDGNNAVPRRLGMRVERLLYDRVIKVEAVYWLDGDRLVMARENSDYKLVSEGEGKGTRIDWLGIRGPKQGDGYSIRYQAPAAYIVNETAPMFRHENNRSLPWRAGLDRLADLAEGDQR